MGAMIQYFQFFAMGMLLREDKSLQFFILFALLYTQVGQTLVFVKGEPNEAQQKYMLECAGRAVSVIMEREAKTKLAEKTISDLGASGKPGMIVFNKIDAYSYIEKAEDDLTPKTKENISLEELMNTWMAKLDANCFFISAKEKTNMDELKTIIYNKVRELHVQKYQYNDFLYQTYDE